MSAVLVSFVSGHKTFDDYDDDDKCSQWRRTVQSWAVRRHWLQAKTIMLIMRAATVVQQCCASLAGLVLSFIACFILLVIAPNIIDLDQGNTVTPQISGGLGVGYGKVSVRSTKAVISLKWGKIKRKLLLAVSSNYRQYHKEQGACSSSANRAKPL